MARGYLITDPDCGFCQKSAGWLQRHFASDWINTPSTPNILQRFDITQEQATTSVWFVLENPDGSLRKSAGAAAVARLIAMRGGAWRIALVATVPPISWASQAVYKLIARNRHRLPGATAACELPKNS